MPQIDPAITQALATMTDDDPAAANLAGTALTWVTGGGGAGRITQERVQRFLWYDLPIKLRPTPEGRASIASALAAVLDLLGLPRYAGICRSEVTRGVHAAYDRGPQEGLMAFREANLASGIYPPDLPEFRWGATMGAEEARTLAGVQDFLELAVASGELELGARNWKLKQRTLVRKYLTSPNFQLGGQTPLDVMNTERIQNWIRVEPAQSRRRLLSALANRLLHPVELPEGVTDPYPALSAALAATAQGDPDGQPDEVMVLATRLRLTRRLHGSTVLTRRGEQVLADPAAHWRLLPESLLQGNPYHRLAGEMLLAMLVDGPSTLPAVVAAARHAAGEANYRESGTGLPPGESSVREAIAPTLEPLQAVQLFEPDDPAVRLALAPVGRTVALEALRHRATGPPAAPWN